MNDRVATLEAAAGWTLRQDLMRYIVYTANKGEGISAGEAIGMAQFIEGFIATTKLAPALEGEPIFVLRAQDKIAPSLVRAWADDAARHDADPIKSIGALKICNEMIVWQIANPGRVKLPD